MSAQEAVVPPAPPAPSVLVVEPAPPPPGYAAPLVMTAPPPRLVLGPPPEENKRDVPLMVGGAVTFGLGAAAMVTGAGFLVDGAFADFPYDGPETQDQKSHRETSTAIGGVMLGAGAAALLIGLPMFLAGRHPSSTTTTTTHEPRPSNHLERARITPTPTGAALRF